MREYPLIVHVRAAVGMPYASWLNGFLKPGDMVSCTGTPGSGDISPIDAITAPGIIKVAGSYTSWDDIPIDTLISQALAHKCQMVALNYEGQKPALTFLDHYEKESAKVRAKGLGVLCVPTAATLRTLMRTEATAKRFSATTDFFYIQTQAAQDLTDNGSYYRDVKQLLNTVRMYEKEKKVAFQSSVNIPRGITVDNVFAQTNSIKGLDWKNGGFSCWYQRPTYEKMKKLVEKVDREILSFAKP